MDLARWLRAEKVAESSADRELLLALAEDMLLTVADDPTAPRAHECAAACELAIAAYHSLAGDWTLAEAVKAVKDQDATTKMTARSSLATARAESKTAWGRTVAEVCIRVRAVRNLTSGTAKRSNVVPYRRAG
jgi:hypothetical protein